MKCKGCGNEINENAKFCKYCGRPNGGSGSRCPACGAEVQEGNVFCINCGHALGDGTDPAERKDHAEEGADGIDQSVPAEGSGQKRRRVRWGKWLLALLLLAVCLSAVAMALHFSGIGQGEELREYLERSFSDETGEIAEEETDRSETDPKEDADQQAAQAAETTREAAGQETVVATTASPELTDAATASPETTAAAAASPELTEATTASAETAATTTASPETDAAAMVTAAPASPESTSAMTAEANLVQEYRTMYVVNCQESITLRTSPSTGAKEICQIPLGEPVSFIESAANGFYKIAYLGNTGYALASYLSETKEAQRDRAGEIMEVVNCRESITLRTSPSISAEEICQIPLGETVYYIETAANGFYKVRYLDQEGYALASFLKAD